MSLIKAIHFRHLSSQLTDQERLQFLSQLVHSHTDIIFTSLFHHLSKPNQINEVTDINNRLSDIIESRKDKPKPLCTKLIQLHQFPEAIIGYVASFLQQKIYIHFSMTNRFIYLACNSPNGLQQLILSCFRDYSCIKLSSFPSVKTLRIWPFKAIESQNNMSFDSPNFNHVTQLGLDADGKCNWVEPFFQQNIINCDHVTALRCSRLGSDDWMMWRNEFVSLFTKFPNITQLTLCTDNFCVSRDVTAQDIADACPKIVGLKVDGYMTSDLIRLFAHQLQYLSLTVEYDYINFDFENVPFGHLKELCISGPHNQLVDGIIKSACKFKKIHLLYWKNRMSEEQIKYGIVNVMIQCKCLDYMRLTASDHTTQLSSVFDGIVSGLLKTKQQQRKQLKVWVTVYTGSEFKANDLTPGAVRVVKALCESDVNEFMLILHIGFLEKVLKEVYHDLCNVSAHIKVVQLQNKIIVSNVNCKINGYQDELNFQVL
eukprot:156029_1